VELPFGRCRILDIDGLITAKEAMDRDHDRITVRQLREMKSVSNQVSTLVRRGCPRTES